MEDFMNIPTDVQRQVLLRAPYISHDELKDVCRSWKEMMCSPRFYEDRKTYGTSQHLICLIQDVPSLFFYGITVYDSGEDLGKDSPYSLRSSSISNLLELLFSEWTSICKLLEIVVFIYDFVSKEWRRGADMSTGRIFFACAVSSSKGLIYVAGGEDEHGNSLATAEAYDVEEDRWEVLPPMTQTHTSAVGVYLEGKFIVITEGSTEAFDEETGSWNTLENMWIFPTRIPMMECNFVCTRGRLYLILSKEVMEYDAQKNVWTPVTSVPGVITLVLCAAAWRDRIFVNGVTEEGNPISYFFQPSTGKWSEVEHQEFAPYSPAYAVTSLEI
eukprot:PITA_07624